jgi:hypothetical protein
MSVVGYLLQYMELDGVAPFRWEDLSDEQRREWSAPLDDDAHNIDDSNALLDDLHADQREQARIAARRFERIYLIRRQREASDEARADAAGMFARSLRAEIAAFFRMPERSAESLLGRSVLLVEDFPVTLESLRLGRIFERHAVVIADEGAGLSDEQRREFERQALPLAEHLRVGLFERKARLIREMILGEELTERHERARIDRAVLVELGADGVGAMYVRHDNVVMAAVDNLLDSVARSLAAEGETRTHAQLRADVLAEMLTDPGALLPPGESEAELRRPVTHRGPVPHVNLAVSAETAMGEDATPGILEGKVAIDAESARRLAGCAPAWRRILTHPETGVILSYGKDRYEVPPDLKRHLRARDGTCRFVGCARSADFCDIDHTVPWAGGGRTDHTNLAHLCRNHHKVKDAGWKVRLDPGGSGRTDWTSPLGREYSTHAVAPPGPKWQAQTGWVDDPPPF